MLIGGILGVQELPQSVQDREEASWFGNLNPALVAVAWLARRSRVGRPS
jgi:hypothetical protein